MTAGTKSDFSLRGARTEHEKETPPGIGMGSWKERSYNKRSPMQKAGGNEGGLKLWPVEADASDLLTVPERTRPTRMRAS